MSVHGIAGMGYDSNIFLVTGRSPILIDAGTGKHLRYVLENLRSFGAQEPITKLILTHRHFDHVGGAAQLAQALQIDVYVHEGDADPVEKGNGNAVNARMFGGIMESLPVKRLKEGEVLSTGEHDLRVIHTPGHTMGSISLYDDHKGILISGDTVFAEGVGRWDLPTGNYDDLVTSVKKLLSIHPKDLYPGHGPWVKDDAIFAINQSLEMLGEV